MLAVSSSLISRLRAAADKTQRSYAGEKYSGEDMKITFQVFGHPEPQGSTRAFVPKGWKRPIITSASAKQKPWRQEVTRTAIDAAEKSGCEIIPRETAVAILLNFYLLRPPSKPKRVTRPTTKPDWDKLSRSICDSLTGIFFEDDSQICDAIVSKHFGTPERVEITVATAGPAVEMVEQSKARSLELFA